MDTFELGFLGLISLFFVIVGVLGIIHLIRLRKNPGYTTARVSQVKRRGVMPNRRRYESTLKYYVNRTV